MLSDASIPMTTVGATNPVREACEKLYERCYRLFPCLSDPARRSSWGLKATLALLHVIFVGVLFLFDSDLIRKTREEPRYTSLYLILFVATLIQYFFTSGSSPGYVIDAMRAGNATNTTFINSSRIPKVIIWFLINGITYWFLYRHNIMVTLVNFCTLCTFLMIKQRQSASRNGSLIPTMDCNQLGRNNSRMNSSSWLKVVMDLYPPGSSSRNWTCTYCNIIQPPRSKHCHDCDKCVLQFDHHCVWLGTCIGQGNHCRFWWYIFEETILCIWTAILYITFLKSKITKAWWEEFIMITLLAALIFCIIFLLLLLFFHSFLVLTNQTTYELVRRRRILYLRGIPDRVQPFTKGICRNLYTFCCSYGSIYTLEAVPTMEELEARARPYTCLDIISCRCC